MRLVTFSVPEKTGKETRIGALRKNKYIDINAAYETFLSDNGEPESAELAQCTTPPDMVKYLRIGNRAIEATKEAIDYAKSQNGSQIDNGSKLVYMPEEVELLSPVPRPNTIRSFSVFEEHLEAVHPDGEVHDVWYEMPIYWKGEPDNIAGPNSELIWPSYTDELDFELEVSAVIGTEGRNISEEAAEDHIFGYMIHNDWSARDMQMREMEMGLGPSKGKDFAYGYGPYLVTANDFHPTGSAYTVTVNGETWVDREISDMYYSFEEMIAHISQDQWVKPGDVINSGTLPEACGLRLDRWLEPGDTISLNIGGLGTLENKVVKE